MMADRKAPVGVFDSGLGGLSVLKELVGVMPRERFLFRGDSANAPYGTKTGDEVLALSRRSTQWLLERGCKEIVVACNTASAVCIEALRKEWPAVPFIGIEPALKPAALENPGGKILLMATPLTLRLERIAALRQRFETKAFISFLPCRGLVELIEGGHLDDDVLFDFLDHLIPPEMRRNLDAAVLGCTHYPHIRPALKRFFEPATRLYDGGAGTARRALAVLRERGLDDPDGTGGVELFNTDPDPALARRAEALMA